MWESLSGSIAGFGLLITDALYLMYLARPVCHLPGNLADWGYATAGHFVLVFLTGCLLPSVSRSGPPVLELDQETIIVFVLMPALRVPRPAVYMWVWSRRVSKLAWRVEHFRRDNTSPAQQFQHRPRWVNRFGQTLCLGCDQDHQFALDLGCRP